MPNSESTLVPKITGGIALLEHIFSTNPLDRAEVERRDSAWLAQALSHPDSRFLPFHRLNVLVRRQSDAAATLVWRSSASLPVADANIPPVLLGISDGVAHFAYDLSHVHEPQQALALDEEHRFEDCRTAAMSLPTPSTGVVAQARAQLNWHRNHRYCGACGAETIATRGGQARHCGGCNRDHFPRTDPVAIMLVVDGDECLLGQPKGPLVRTGMYSALAGFIDQGESIEEAVRREVMEEAGIRVGAVSYHSSQPWPFPSSLMIGCHAHAISSEIHIDSKEMHDVRWCSRVEVQDALNNNSPTLKVPGPIAIAHHLIAAWANNDVGF